MRSQGPNILRSAVTQVDSTIWRALERVRPDSEEVHCRRVLSGSCDNLYCAIDRNLSRYLLIQVAQNDSIEESCDRYLSIRTRTLWHAEGSARFIAIRCVDPVNHPFFDYLGAALAHELQSAEPPARIVARELARWRRFWRELPSPLLTREQQLGLFAELWFLHVWLYPRIGPAEAVRRWRGPFSARHDFEWLDRAVEVKGTSSQRGRIHHINGLDQLRVPENGRLLLFSIKLRESGSARNSLPALVAACRQPILDDPDILSQFESALARSGYFESQQASYTQLTLEASSELLFGVDERFPKLTSAAIDPTALAGIERVEYDLNLTSYEQLALVDADQINECLS